MSVSLLKNGAFERGTAQSVFGDKRMALSGFDFDVLPDYDVTPDGTKFVLLTIKPEAAATEIHVVLNWFEELNRLTKSVD